MTESSHRPKRSNSRRIRMLVGGVVFLVAMGVLLWLGLERGTVYYYSVTEMKTVGAVQRVRVSGELEGGSLTGGVAEGFVFTLYDRDSPAVKLDVTYDGALPDAFKNEPGAEVVAEGDYDGGGIFSAHTLIVKCPSKYEAAE